LQYNVRLEKLRDANLKIRSRTFDQKWKWTYLQKNNRQNDKEQNHYDVIPEVGKPREIFLVEFFEAIHHIRKN
jgi:hypothetical protein